MPYRGVAPAPHDCPEEKSMAIKVESIELSTGGLDFEMGYCDMKVEGFFHPGLFQKLQSIMGERNSVYAEFKRETTIYRIIDATPITFGINCVSTGRSYICFKINRDGLSVVHGSES